MSVRVLIVDDYEDSADCVALLLTMLSCETGVAYNADAALQAAEQFKPDLFLIDLGLPSTDGFVLAGRIRQLPAFSGSLLVAYTGYQQYRQQAEASGFDDYLLKPVSMESLQQLLLRVLDGIAARG